MIAYITDEGNLNPVRKHGFDEMNRTALIAIVAVAVLIVVGGGIAVIGGIGHSITEDKGTLTAETYTVDKLSTSMGWKTASTGNTYVLALITITNDKESSGISNNSYYMEIKTGGITYTCNSYTYTILHEKAYVLKDIGKGASDTSCYVFEIPKSDVATAEVVYNGACNLSCKTTYKGETTMKANLTYDIVVSQQYLYDLTDGTAWSPNADYKFLELKIKMTCNFEDIQVNSLDWKMTVGGKTYYIDTKCSQLVTDPYIVASLTKGQTVTVTQVYQIPVGADMSTTNVVWNDSLNTAEGKVTIVNG